MASSPQWTTNAQQVLPAAANGISLTPSNSAWVNSSWAQITAAISGASVLTGVTVVPPTDSVEFEIDIGTGAGGSEVVIATIRGRCVDNSGSPNWWPFPIAVDNIANNVRVAARIRTSGTSTTAWGVAITYLSKPITGTFLTTAAVPTIAPAAANGITATAGGTAWTNGTYVTILASTATAVVLAAVQMYISGGPVEVEVDIATGAASSEVVITTLRSFPNASGSGDGSQYTFTLATPLDNIATATRIAARMRSATASKTAVVAVMFYPKPL